MLVAQLSLGFISGLVLGALFFLSLRATVRLHVSGSAAIPVTLAYFARIAFAFGAFWLIAQYGAYPLLSALAGFMLARYLIQAATVRC